MFEINKNYTFKMKSFRPRNGFMFAQVQHTANVEPSGSTRRAAGAAASAAEPVTTNIEILIGNASDYRLADLLELKRADVSITGDFHEMKSVNGNEYPRFWNVAFS